MAERLEGAVEAMAVLRARCPWSSEQDHRSLIRYAREETEELIDALEELTADPSPGNRDHVVEELGDVLYQVLFHAALLDESGGSEYGTTLGQVIDALEAKLIRRHPLAFDGHGREGPMPSLADVEREYRRIKAAERAQRAAERAQTGTSAEAAPAERDAE
ncbi:MazG nucleotide pyrophosphohydrolase domain-containing protein [Brevibacterium sp. 2SA]|nr:MazG nucleotide pyrophosphohydrolase domain-containing protein [Brevibacterium sp. 2SA]